MIAVVTESLCRLSDNHKIHFLVKLISRSCFFLSFLSLLIAKIVPQGKKAPGYHDGGMPL